MQTVTCQTSVFLSKNNKYYLMKEKKYKIPNPQINKEKQLQVKATSMYTSNGY